MHFVVSWDIEATGQEWEDLNNKMKDKLAPYSWVRPLSTFYIVQINSYEIWNSILSSLTQISRSSKKKINFVMSPLMNGGNYNGSLPQNLWDEINKRSKSYE